MLNGFVLVIAIFWLAGWGWIGQDQEGMGRTIVFEGQETYKILALPLWDEIMWSYAVR